MMRYDDFLELVKYRRSIRKFKPDPISAEYITKILDAAHYSMSGANSQPWEFIVVRDPEIRKRLNDAYVKHDFEKMWNVEQMRAMEFRHPGLQFPFEEKDKAQAIASGWRDAPVYLAVLKDPRKQWGSVLIAFERPDMAVLAATMGHLSMTIHLAAASLGLGSARIDVSCQEPYREILGYPEPLLLDIIVPIGYRAYEPGPPHRVSLEERVHYDKYDMSKYMRHEDFLKYIEKIRLLGTPGYQGLDVK
jgi:nitroreductase